MVHPLIYVDIDGIHFADGQLTKNWYNGRHVVNWLQFKTGHLQSIHANAFDGPAFQALSNLLIFCRNSAVKFHDGAFDQLKSLVALEFGATKILRCPRDLFEPLRVAIGRIEYMIWPSSVNMNDMFGRNMFRMLKVLRIQNVDMPQTKFRRLAATNFTSFRRLKHLYLINCGIEVIDRHTFDGVGHTLSDIYLDKNRIKNVDVDMFRELFETKASARVQIKFNQPLWCSCSVIELQLIQYPLIDDEPVIDCMPNNERSTAHCTTYQSVNPKRFCLDWKYNSLKTINIRMKRIDDSVWIKTNFSTEFRILVSKVSTVKANCRAKMPDDAYKCFNIDKFMDQLDLDDITEVKDAEFVWVSVMPVLYGFGACPFHTILVHQPSDIVHIDAMQLIFIAFVASIFSSIIGVLCMISMWRLATFAKTHQMNSNKELFYIYNNNF